MKKLLLLLLFFSFFSFSQENQGLITFNNKPNYGENDGLGYDLLNSFVLKNGNILYFASVDLDYKTANSECQCSEYSFGKVFWIFQKDNEGNIVKQRCYKENDFLNYFNINVQNRDELWSYCYPEIKKVFYRGDDLYFYFVQGLVTKDKYLNTTTRYHRSGSSSNSNGAAIISKFNLETFDFYEPEGISKAGGGRGYDKFYYIDDKFPVSLYAKLDYSNPQNNYDRLISSGYQNLMFGGIDNTDYRNAYDSDNINLIEKIFDGNSKEIILDYKQDDKNSLTFLVASNSLDGLYNMGEEYKTSIYTIKATFNTYNHSNTNDKTIQVDVEFDVKKSTLSIPRNIDLSYDDYKAFVDNNNNFALSVNSGENFDIDVYNKLHFIYDDGSHKTINLDNDYDHNYKALRGLSFDSGFSSSNPRAGHTIINIEFTEKHIVTTEDSRFYVNDERGIIGTNRLEIKPLRIIKFFDRDGVLLSRNVFFREPYVYNDDDGNRWTRLNPESKTRFHYSTIDENQKNFIGVKYLSEDVFLIDNFDDTVWCGHGLESKNQPVYKLKYIPNISPKVSDFSVSLDEDTSTDISLNGSDDDGDEITYIIVDETSKGTLSLQVDKVNYIPNENYNGEDSFTYKANDGTIDSELATVTINIKAVNDAPVAKEQSLTTEEEISLDIVLEGSDVDGDELTYAIVDNPANGTVTIDKSNVNYIPSSGYFGDDSFTFKVNDGIIDSEKVTVYISVTSNDLDNDGILNADDTCPETPEGSAVDFNGCPIFSLPLDNNKVWVTSASCIGNTDGSIGLSVEDASFNYTVTVTGQDDPITLGGETKTASVTGLGTGTYTVCFKVDGQDTYEQCFEVSIAEPKALSAFIDVDNDNKTTSIQLSGSSSYNVEVNGQRFDVKGDRFTTNLPTGLSIIKISTDLDCQGIIEREVFISEDIHYYPNPTQTDVNVHVSGEDTLVQVSVFSEKGDLIYTREQQIQDFSRKTNIDLSRQITGTYIVVMQGKTVRKTFKIVKR